MERSNRGIVKTAQGKAALTPIPIPKLRDDYILVKTVAVALNPTDWQTLDEVFQPATTHTLLGCDSSGIVVEVGKDVTRDFKPGDRIMGMAHGGNELQSEDGTFAEYIVLKGDIAMHIPPNLSFEEACTVGGGMATIALALYRHLELPFPTLPLEEKSTDGRYILIYGGSTASGTLAIQFSKLSGLKVIATSSPHNFELLKSIGADHVFDYRDPDCGSQIRSLTNNALTLVLDTIATPSSALICSSALTSSPSLAPTSLYVNLMGIPFPRAEIRNIFYLGYSVTGEAFEIEGERWDADERDFALARRFAVVMEQALAEGRVRAHPTRVRHGIEGILDGMRELKEGRVSGEKLVYRI